MERTQRAVTWYLDGVILATRFGRAPREEEIVDTVLRLFLVTTKPKEGEDVDLDAALLGGRATAAPTSGPCPPRP